MSVEKHLRGDNGQAIFEIVPYPRVHVAVVTQPTENSVLMINAGQVTFEAKGSGQYCAGFADGFNRHLTMNTASIVYVALAGGDPCELYARWYDQENNR